MQRLLPVFVAILLIAVLGVAASTAPGWAGTASPAASVAPPSVDATALFPVVVLQGDEYTMGRQYGQQVPFMIEATARASRAALLGRYSGANLSRALQALEARIRVDLPGRDMVGFMHGVADGARAGGADVTYEDVLLINCYAAFWGPRLPVEESGGCTNVVTFGSATAGGETIVGSTLDLSPDPTNMEAVIVLAYPAEGHAFLSVGAAGRLTTNFAMNDAGLVQVVNKAPPSGKDTESAIGVPMNVLMPYLMMRFANAEDALAYAERTRRPLGANQIFADANGTATVLESTASLSAVRRPGDRGEGDYLVATNHFLQPAMRPAQNPWDPLAFYPSSYYRYLSAERIVREANGTLDTAGTMALLASTRFWNGTSWSGEARWTGNTINRFAVGGTTLDAKVAVPATRTVFICAGNPGAPEWSALAPGRTGEYVAYRLADSAANSTIALRTGASAALQSAAAGIGVLEDPWRALEANERLDRAKAAYWEGEKALTDARLALDGDERSRRFGLAATAYAEATALAQQLGRALNATA